QTRYVQMILDYYHMSWTYNALASLFTWLLLAGYIFFPGTFTSLRSSNAAKGEAGEAVLHAVQNVGLLWAAGILCVISVVGMVWLWWRLHENFAWVLQRIFLPTFINSITGLITTIVNIYTARGGGWSVTAKATIAVTGASAGISFMLYLIY
ncbi:hypothetical protein K432DRAFT_252713, partial [Lepidopterella palustris CBS 459.81]